MEYFDGFAWAVPWEFHDAVDQCCFERGDIIYDSAGAYGPDWVKARETFRHFIQVRFPEQLASGTGPGGESVFRANWRSVVRLDVFDGPMKVESDLLSTQGRLYTTLWRGDLAILRDDYPEPRAPDGWRDILPRLESVKPVAESLKADGSVFVMPYDPASALSLEKFRAVESALSANLRLGPEVRRPSESCLSAPDTVAPTVSVAFFPVSGLTDTELADRLKAVLYVPTKGARRSQFRVSAHGAVF